MKKSFFSILFVVLFLAGFSNISNAETNEKCLTVTVDCGDGNGGYGLACGNTSAELISEALELADVICG